MESLSFRKGKKICYIFCHFGKDQTIQNFEQEWDTQCLKRASVLFSLAGYFSVSGEPIGRFPSKLGYRPNFSRQSIWAGHWAASSTFKVRF